MGKSSLYDFFKTKDEIVVYAVEKEIEETIKKVHRIIADESSPEQCLRKIMLNHLGVPKQYRTVLMWLNTESDRFVYHCRPLEWHVYRLICALVSPYDPYHIHK